MRKLNFFLSGVLLAVCIAAGGGARLTAEAAGTQYYLGGMTAGFSLSANGVEIVAFKEVASESGGGCPAAQAGMKTGDLIVAVDGIHTRTIAELGRSPEAAAAKHSLSSSGTERVCRCR